jgi:hypothetical protein
MDDIIWLAFIALLGLIGFGLIRLLDTGDGASS